jgi:hypothetical protein
VHEHRGRDLVLQQVQQLGYQLLSVRMPRYFLQVLLCDGCVQNIG